MRAGEFITEFRRTDDDGREFMSWQEFLAIVTPAMRGWGFDVKNKQPQIMYSRSGRGQGEYYIIILDPQEDMVQYSFMTMDGDQPEMHETNFVGMDRNGAHSLLAKIDEGYSLSDIKRNMAEEQVNELGNSPSEYKPNRKRKRSLFHATVDGNWVDVFFDRSEFNGTLHITFTVNGDYDAPSRPTEASKSTVRILSTVLNIVKQRLPEYMAKARPPAVSFTSKEDNRAGLYRKYFVPVIQNILGSKWAHEEYPSMGMTVFHWKPVKKQDMSEDTPLPGDFKLMGQNLFLKNLARNLKQRYPDATVKLSSDRVTAYRNEGDNEDLSVMGTEVMDSGYIGVGLDDAFTESFQGVLVPTIKQTTEQLLAANPGTKPALFLSTDNWNPDAWTHIATKLGYRLVADDEQLDENFADGKNPGRKGLAKRSGVNTKASVSTLRNVAKHSTGEKQRMAHWLANMKAGRAKARKK